MDVTPPSGDVFAEGEARILDRGFRHYDGPRRPRQAFTTVVVHSIQRGLGFRRKTSAKVLPFIAVAAAYIPAIVMVGLAALFRGGTNFDLELPSYSDYFSSISLAILLLSALVAPEVFGNDQRNGMLGIYLASPLTRTGYLAAKASAVAIILGLITAGPQLLLLIANTVQGVGPEDPVEWLGVLLKILASGVVVSLLLTAMSVAVTVLANNKGIATAIIVVLLLVVSVMALAFAEGSGVDAWRVFSVLDLAFSLPPLIHGDATEMADLAPAGVAWTGFVLWVVAGTAISWFRLQRLEVTR